MENGNWQRLKEYMQSRFPFWRPTLDEITVADELISEKTVPISPAAYDSCIDTVEAFSELRKNKKYIEHVRSKSNKSGAFVPGNHSIMMSFDFHVDGSETRLIEINTNAAFSSIVWAISLKDNVKLKSVTDEFDKSLRAAMVEEGAALDIKHLDFRVAIIDDNPKEQNAYFEFKLFKELFENWGWDTLICDPSELDWDQERKVLTHADFGVVNFVYNRSTDFVFEDPKHAHLHEAFVSRKVCFSPNPHEYSLMADKNRLIELSDHRFLQDLELSENARETISKVILRSFSVTDLSQDELWEKRKSLFFKPKTAFGSKGVYRGDSITRKAFDRIYNDGFLAQEYFPPSKHEGFKYDLRFYTYQSEIQLVAARMYKGQVTNVKTLGGGLASVEIV